MAAAPTNTSLRRSGVGTFREVVNVSINDDDEERRQARLQQTQIRGSTSRDTLDQSETLKKCLEIYNENKLSKDNAWSLTLIDTLSVLLDKHHKSLNNFKVAGSSLEASSRVYGLRVDSVHVDVLRMSAGLNAHTYSNEAAAGGDRDELERGPLSNQENPESGSNTAVGEDANCAKVSKPKKTRKRVSTITKNKDSLNARLDTIPLFDPVFNTLNSIDDSVNSSNCLLNNFLPCTESELNIRPNFPSWDATAVEGIDYTEEQSFSEDQPWKACDKLIEITLDDLKFRSMHSGYVISDAPEEQDNEAEKENSAEPLPLNTNNQNSQEMSLAFDINADVEPIPLSNQTEPFVDVDFEYYEDLTTEERVAINRCKGLRKAAVIIEDLRPIDPSSKLEYSYRPLDKINQFWAGPSHWKFKRNRPCFSIMPIEYKQQQISNQQTSKIQQCRSRPKQRTSQPLKFGEFNEDLFIELNEQFKPRKYNIKKKWDARKYRLPTDHKLDPNMFDKFHFAPGISVVRDAPDIEVSNHNSESPFDNFETNEPHHSDDFDCGVIGNLNEPPPGCSNAGLSPNNSREGEAVSESTVLEIASDFEGAPSQVTKIIVPFAKRAKVVDMKSLKKCCMTLLKNQMNKKQNSKVPELPAPKDEQYGAGIATFRETYSHLPEVLTHSMAEALSPSVALYSILHLANENNLRLIQQDDLEDFTIRQVLVKPNT